MLRLRHAAWTLVCSGAFALGQSCQGGVPAIEGEYYNLDNNDAGTEPITDVVTIDSGCAKETSRGKLRPSNLLFVVDRSGSMGCNPPEDGQSTKNCLLLSGPISTEGPSKWDLTEKAVESALTELRRAGTVRAGLSLFPKAGSRCTVTSEPEVAIATLDEEQQAKMVAAMMATTPFGETPLAGATILSYAHLLEGMRSEKLDGESFVVLITDGYETCKTEEIPKLLSEDVPNARNLLGVRTYVIGAPGSDEGRALLSEMAVAAGTELSGDCTYGPSSTDGNCHYDMTESVDFASDLLDALTRVNAEVLACTIELPTDPNGGSVDLRSVNVLVNGKSRPMQNDGACSKTDGWRYASDYSSIHLCGNVCREAKQKGAEVTVILGCPTVVPQ